VGVVVWSREASTQSSKTAGALFDESDAFLLKNRFFLAFVRRFARSGASNIALQCPRTPSPPAAPPSASRKLRRVCRSPKKSPEAERERAANFCFFSLASHTSLALRSFNTTLPSSFSTSSAHPRLPSPSRTTAKMTKANDPQAANTAYLGKISRDFRT
jgi:hypothetical protein